MIKKDFIKKACLVTAIVASLALTACGGGGSSAKNKYIKINKYDGLEVQKVEKTKVTDEDVDAHIDMMLEDEAKDITEVPDRAIEKGDVIILDCSAADADGNVLAGTELKDYELEIGSGAFIEGWEDACIGKPFAEEFTFDLKFPEGYGGEELSGKNATWTVTAKALKTGVDKRKLDDKVAAELAESEGFKAKTVDDFKKQLKKKLQEEAETSYKDTLKSEAFSALMNETEVIQYPKGAVDERVEAYMDTYEKVAKENGITVEEYFEQMGQNTKDVKANLKSAAKENVKQELACDLLMDKLGIKISDKQYQKEYKKLAKAYGFASADEFLKQAGKESAELIVKQNKVGDWLIEHCKQVDKNVKEVDLTEQQTEQSEEQTEEQTEKTE